jgi:Spy/CpxP family protein refolding chaperone
MRYIIALAIGLCATLASTWSLADEANQKYETQTKKSPTVKPLTVYNPSTNFEQFSKDLDLTPSQQQEIRPLLDDLEQRLQPLQKLTLQRRGKRGAPIVAEQYQRIREKLDSDQLMNFNKMVDRGEITPFVK